MNKKGKGNTLAATIGAVIVIIVAAAIYFALKAGGYL